MKKRINIHINEQVHKEFKSKVSLEGKTITKKLLEWIQEYLKDNKKK